MLLKVTFGTKSIINLLLFIYKLNIVSNLTLKYILINCEKFKTKLNNY